MEVAKREGRVLHQSQQSPANTNREAPDEQRRLQNHRTVNSCQRKKKGQSQSQSQKPAIGNERSESKYHNPISILQFNHQLSTTGFSLIHSYREHDLGIQTSTKPATLTALSVRQSRASCGLGEQRCLYGSAPRPGYRAFASVR